MTYFLYNLLLFIASPFYILRVLWKNKGCRERFGIIPSQASNKKTIWIHAVSVGEVIASKPLISLINKQLPDYEVVLSTVTETGRQMAKKLKEKISYIFYFPFDFPFVIEKVLSRLRPSLIILAETELWPNLLRYAQYSKIPVISTNGTISDTSFERYKRIRPIFKDVINKVSYFCMQTQRDKERLINLGVKPEKIIVTGNTKFDLLDADSVKEQPFENWNIKEFSPVIVAGSTHAGEEEFLIESFRAIVKKFPKALLILVPRHPDRVPEIENLIRAQRYSYRKRSEMSLFALEENIIIVDTIGELSKIYTSADIVFMGGSLVRIGGHNLLEPAFLAKPIITGPYTFKQNEMVELLKENDGIVQLESKEELKEKLLELLSSPEKRKKLGENAYKVALSNQGATRKNFEVIEKFLHKF